MESYFSLFKNAPFGIVYYNIDGGIVDVNPAAEHIFHMTKKQLVSENLNTLGNEFFGIDGAVIERDLLPWNFSGSENPQPGGDIIGMKRDGFLEAIWLKVHGIAECCDDDTLKCAFIEDVTECHRWKMNVLEAGNIQKTLMSTSRDSTVIIREGEIIYANPESLRFLGYSEEEVLGKDIVEFVPPGEIEKALEIYNRRTAGERLPAKHTTQAKTKNGDIVDVEVSLNPFVYDFAPATRLVLRDVTKQHSSEKRLAENEMKLNSIVQGSRSAIFTINDQRKFTFINSAGLELFGYPENEVLNHDFSLVLDNESKALVSERYAKRQNGEDVPPQYRFSILRKNGEKRRVEIYSSVIIDSESRSITVANLTDVTEKEIRQQVIDEAQNRLMSFFNANDDLMFIKDHSRRYLEGNKAICRFFNKPIEEIIGKTDEELAQPGVIDSCTKSDVKVIENQEIVCLEEKLGDSFFSVTKFPIVVNDEILVGGILHDITHRKQAEEELRMKDRAIDASINAIVITNMLGEIIYVNEAAEKLWLFNRSEMTGKLIREFCIGEWICDNISEISAKGYSHGENLATRTDGSVIDIQYSSTLVRDKNNTPAYVFNSFVDISKRKRHEKLQKILLNISQKSDINVTLGEFISNIHLQLKTIIKADNFYIAMYDKKTGLYNFPYYFDEYDDVDDSEQVELSQSLTDLVRRSEKGYIINNRHYEVLSRKEDVKIIGQHSENWIWMGAPILNTYMKDPIGVMAVQDYADNLLYTQDDLLAIEIISGYIGQFISRLQTIEDLRTAKLLAQENENRYKALFNDSASVMLLIDTETGRIVGANHSACEYYGYAYEEMVALNINQVNVFSDKQIREEMHKAASEERSHFLFKHRLSNGEQRHVEVYSSKVVVNDKPLLYSIIHDITEKKRSEEEIARLSEAILQSPEPIALTDIDGYFIYVNPRYCELSGYSEQELLASHTRILKSGHQSVEFYADLWNTITAGEIWYGEIINKKKDGELFIEEVNIAPVMNENGITTHYLKASRDVTKQRKMVKELVAAKEKAEESDRLKTAFLANMSHEIRTPMNGILGFTSLLSEPDFSEDDKLVFIESIQKSGDRMLNTVNDIIEISKIEVGEVTMRKKMVNVNTKITEIVDFFLPEAIKKGLGLDSRLTLDNENALLLTDESKLESIITNLIKNAIKYSDSGNIEFGYHVKNDTFEFYCKDDGIGIPENRKEAIFNRFEQADIDDKRVFQGSGLGLSITKAYVEMLDGKIGVDSVVDKGSVFRFTLPIELTDQGNSFNEDETRSKVGTPVENELVVLIAEDDEVSVSYLEIILTNRVKKFFFAANGLEAVEAVRNHPEIDIVLMDIQLPVMDGYQATKNIRAFNTNVKIVAQTAYALEGDKEVALKAGCDDYLSKPIKKPALLAILEKYKA